jgi:hypothetical protein
VILFILAAFLAGMVLGNIRALATYEPMFDDLRRQVQAALESLDEWEKQEQPKFEAKILERMFRK